ncbi:MAG: hypothetical protein LBQ32_00600 [Burkholderiaceae bacterium]|nr:hypothetical protein [Burkholderiaceae bacterium]
MCSFKVIVSTHYRLRFHTPNRSFRILFFALFASISYHASAHIAGDDGLRSAQSGLFHCPAFEVPMPLHSLHPRRQALVATGAILSAVLSATVAHAFDEIEFQSAQKQLMAASASDAAAASRAVEQFGRLVQAEPGNSVLRVTVWALPPRSSQKTQSGPGKRRPMPKTAWRCKTRRWGC